MNMKKINKSMMTGLLIISLVLVPWASNGFAAIFTDIVVFGDSLSDNGNLLLIDGQPKPDSEIYYQGRFSNGLVWVEYLANPQRLNTSLSDRALGGAQSDGLVPPGLIEQASVYIATDGPQLSSSALFIIWIGGNDYFNGDGNFMDAVDNIKDAMERLVEFGARHLLVMNLPDLGTIPDTLGLPEAAPASAFSVAFNNELATMLDTFSLAYPQIGLYEFDVFSFFRAIQDDPGTFGFTNTTDPSPNFFIPNNFDGDGHVFWDDKHPTTETHVLLADQVFAELNEQVPMPVSNDDDDDNTFTCFIGSAMQ
jgi:phospholipase/lecithinase/hemolysin